MADNTPILNAASAVESVATDDIGGVKYQRVKMTYGVDGTADDVSATKPLPVEEATVSKGYQQVTSTAAAATLASLCSGGVLPTGATRVLLTPSAAIRIRDDGTSPTTSIGYPIPANTEWKYDGDQLAALKIFGAATIDCWFFF